MNTHDHAERAWKLWLQLLDVEASLWAIYEEHFEEFMFPENQNDPLPQPELFENSDPFS
jgi:hypothetical protein